MNSRMPTAVVISAFAADPRMSSETGIGWMYIKQVARYLLEREYSGEFVIICNGRSSEAIGPELKAFGDLGLNIIVLGIDVPRMLTFLAKNPQLTRLEYLVWNAIARSRLRNKFHTADDAVLAQHITFATEMLPTPVTGLKCAAFRVWGPVGAAGDSNVYNLAPRNKYSRREARTQRLRDLLSLVAIRTFGSRVDLAVAQNSTVNKRFLKAGIASREFPNVIVSESLRGQAERIGATPSRGERPISILCVGHQIARKRFEVAVAALTAPELGSATLTFLGKPLPGSPDYLPGIVDDLGVRDRVYFKGKVPRTAVMKHMVEADVLVHPSAREGASGVVGEATAVGLPVVCFAGTGASSVLSASGASGIALPARGASIDDIARAIVECAALPREPVECWNEDRFFDFFASLFELASDHLFRSSPKRTSEGS